MIRGIRATRMLAAAYAEVMLRKRGKLPPLTEPEQIGKRARPWTDNEVDDAMAGKLRGEQLTTIAERHNRTKGAVSRKLGEMLRMGFSP